MFVQVFGIFCALKLNANLRLGWCGRKAIAGKPGTCKRARCGDRLARERCWWGGAGRL